MSIQANLKEVLSELPAGVRLVAVSKFHPNEALEEAYAAGQRIFGESHVQEMKRLNPADYEERQLDDFYKYVFGMSYQTLKDVMKQQKGREEQCRKQGCWWKRKEQLAKKQHHTGSTCR